VPESWVIYLNWAWLTAGVLLLALEAILPGAVIMWFGVAAIVVGLVLSVWPELGVNTQFVMFAVLSISMLAAFRLWRRNHPPEGTGDTNVPRLNKRATQYIGQTVTVTQAIENGQGRVAVGDSTWRASGPDAAHGTRVRVVSAEGGTLQVEIAE